MIYNFYNIFFNVLLSLNNINLLANQFYNDILNSLIYATSFLNFIKETIIINTYTISLDTYSRLSVFFCF